MARQRASGSVPRGPGKAAVSANEHKRTKLYLAEMINCVLNERGLKQKQAARLLQVRQPKVSALANYRLGGFSVERLLKFLIALGRNVEIVISQPSNGQTPAIRIATGAEERADALKALNG